MSEKQKIIAEMIAMQKKMLALEKRDGIDFENYYTGEQEGLLQDYQKRYTELSNRLVDLAHSEKGSHR